MMIDTVETLNAEIDAIRARVAAFEQAQKRVEEPPALDDDEYIYLVPTRYKDHEMPPNATTRRKAAARLRWCEAELARLREGLEVQEDDLFDASIAGYVNMPHRTNLLTADFYREQCVGMAREIQRHRKLVSK